MIVIETEKLPASEGSIGKVRYTHEGVGEIKNGKIVIKKSEIVDIEFTQLNQKNQRENVYLCEDIPLQK